MQVIYAVPFVMVSLAAFFLFLGIPRLRAHAFAALAAPVAFGGCSIFGLMLFVLVLDTQYDSLPRSIAIGGPLLAYLGSGFAGAWVAIRVVEFVEHRLHWK